MAGIVGDKNSDCGIGFGAGLKEVRGGDRNDNDGVGQESVGDDVLALAAGFGGLSLHQDIEDGGYEFPEGLTGGGSGGRGRASGLDGKAVGSEITFGWNWRFGFDLGGFGMGRGMVADGWNGERGGWRPRFLGTCFGGGKVMMRADGGSGLLGVMLLWIAWWMWRKRMRADGGNRERGVWHGRGGKVGTICSFNDDGGGGALRMEREVKDGEGYLGVNGGWNMVVCLMVDEGYNPGGLGYRILVSKDGGRESPSLQ